MRVQKFVRIYNFFAAVPTGKVTAPALLIAQQILSLKKSSSNSRSLYQHHEVCQDPLIVSKGLQGCLRAFIHGNVL